MTAMEIEGAPDLAASERKVKKSSFYTALRILPKPQREAMYEIYAFCRDVDDIADDEGPHDERKAAIGQWRRDIDALYAGQTTTRTRSLLGPIRQFALERADFQAVIDGMAMDIDGPIRAPDWATLDLYCDRVASAVGRLSVKVFGMGEADGIALAHHLGRALQLTNILRDIDEDAAIGRLYLPREALVAAGIASDDPEAVMAEPRIGQACEPVIERARTHFTEARTIMARNPRRLIRTPMLMYEAYRSILDGVVARGFAAPRARIRLSKLRMVLLLILYGFV